MLGLNRKVGLESQKSYATKVKSGFFDKYLAGARILDVGFAGHGGDGQPIVPHAIGIDLNYPGYDGITLPFDDESQDAVYSSHCFEHIEDHIDALKDWFRVLRVGGFVVLVVPHQYLFERRESMPSLFNRDHKRFFTPASLLADIERALPVNGYRIRHMCDNDQYYDYSLMPQMGQPGCFEIELVIEKLPEISWTPDIGTARDYAPSELSSTLNTGRQWSLETNFSGGSGCWVFGPYVPLSKGQFIAEFFLEAEGLGSGDLNSPISLDIARDMIPTEFRRELMGRSGADALRAGPIELKFANDAHGAIHEFRIFVDGEKPFPGSLRLNGIRIKMMNW